MTREQAYLRMLTSTAHMQWNIAIMLEAKAAEAEKMRSWVCNHLSTSSFSTQQVQLSQSLGMHDQVIEFIDGLTKLNQSMVSILKVVLPQQEGADEGFGDTANSFGGFGDKS